MKALVTLTVPEGKKIIAKAISLLPHVQDAFKSGRILCKGGTTVSAVLEEIAGYELRISGRISPRGTKGSGAAGENGHSILLEQGKIINVDHSFADAVQRLTRTDVAIIGANALDSSGRAAMMFGSPLGGNPGLGLSGLMAQGCQVLIACGLEKLIPTSIDQAVEAAGMASFDWAMGMAVGLAPLTGKVITEQSALESLACIRCTVIGAGGIDGAEGAQTLVIEGERKEVEKIIGHVLSVKGANTSGEAASLQECVYGSPGCSVHRSCAWRKEKGGDLAW